MSSFRNDTAAILLNRISKQLQQTNQDSSDFALVVGQKLGQVLIGNGQNTEAIRELLKTIDLCKIKQRHDIRVRCMVNLVLSYGAGMQLDKCYQTLMLTEREIKTYRLDSLFPYFGNRACHYYLTNGKPDSALYFARKTILLADQYHVADEGALGRMLMGSILRDSLPDSALFFYHKANLHWKASGNMHGYSWGLRAIAKTLMQKGDKTGAMAYNDSALLVLSEKKYYDALSSVWNQRADFFKTGGRYDSALIAREKAFDYERLYTDQLSRRQIAQAEALYNDEKKSRTIAEQSLEINQSEEQRKKLWWGLGIAIIFSLLLVYFFMRIRKSKKKIDRQAGELVVMNKEQEKLIDHQRILLSEVHHRVKNNLQTVISMLEMQAAEVENEEQQAIFYTMCNRIFSIAAVHNLMYGENELEEVNLRDYIITLLEHIGDANGRPELKLDLIASNIQFNLDTLVPLGMLLNELLTNSGKYARTENQQLIISISLKQVDHENYTLCYTDNGQGF
ncbi:MAG: sensor histidine kinase, partial [Bacteroidia bacterium]